MKYSTQKGAKVAKTWNLQVMDLVQNIRLTISCYTIFVLQYHQFPSKGSEPCNHQRIPSFDILTVTIRLVQVSRERWQDTLILSIILHSVDKTSSQATYLVCGTRRVNAERSILKDSSLSAIQRKIKCMKVNKYSK